MWSSKAIRSSGAESDSSHDGAAWCQTSACPFTCMPCASAKRTIASPPEKSKTPRVFSIGSHFISHSAVRSLKCRAAAPA